MNKFRRQLLLSLYKLMDVGLMVAAFSFATVATHFRKNNIPFSDFLEMRIALKNFIIFLGYILVWFIIFSALKLYHSRRLSNRLSEIVDVFKATFLGTFILTVFSLLFSIDMITPIFLFVFLSTVTFLTILFRVALRMFLGGLRRHGRNLREILIAGTNERAVKFARSIETRPDLGYHIQGFVDEDWPGIGKFSESGYPLVSDFNQLLPYIREHVVDEVAINLPMKSYYGPAAQIAAICAEQGIIVRQFTDIYDFRNGHLHPETVDEHPWLIFSNGSLRGLYLEMKRGVDLLVSSVLLVLTLPLFLVIALLIRLTSKGPVFFIQERVGLNKRIFKMIKFRTMVVDAEQRQQAIEHLNEASGPVFKIRDDPRMTPFGRLLRKSSLDELPQLVNILKGEMSLIGPRPLPLRDYKGFDQDWHRRRLSVRPGVTCLWQVSGRSDITFEKWMELDMEYIDNWTPWMDIKILFKTIPAVIKGNGAV